MSEGKDTPRFTVVDRRKFRGDDEAAVESSEPKASEPATSEPETKAVPRLTLVEPVHQAVVAETPVAAAEELDEDREFLGEPGDDEPGDGQNPELPPAPSAEESRFQKAAYDKAAERLDDLVRAQNPGAPPAEKIGFEHVVQQFYLSAMMQMGAGTPEGQRPRIDILGARQTIDLLEVLLEKTVGNISPLEQRTLETVLFELRMTFMELTRMIATQAQPPMPPPPGGAKR